MDEQAMELLRSLTVEAMLELRASYLRTPGCNVLKHWDQLTDRLRAAARSSASPEEWVTTMMRTLQLGAPREGSASRYRDLADFVRERDAASAWLDLLEREYGYIMAVARGVAEQRKEVVAHA